MASLVNKDLPDLPSPDGASGGIEVTRAMEESRFAKEALLEDIAGKYDAIDKFHKAYMLRG